MKLLTTREVADRLRVSTTTVRIWARTGRLPVIRMTPRKLLFEEAAIEAAVRGNSGSGETETAGR